jgi:ribonuclease J
MEDRRLLAEDGAITVLGILNTKTGRLAEPVEFIARGFNHDADWAANAAQIIDKAIVAATRNSALDGAALERIFSESVTRWMQRKYRRNPVITAVVVDA